MYDKYYKVDNENIVCIGFDEYSYCFNPREMDEGNLGTFLTWLNGYISPDQNDFDSFEEFINEFDVYPNDWDWNEEDVINELVANADEKGYFLYPVYVYEHSQIHYSIYPTIPYGCIGGVIYVEKEKVFKNTSLTESTEDLRNKVKEMLGGEVEEFDDWANGNVMYYEVYNIKENHVIDSLNGFIGEEPSANGIMDYLSDYDISEKTLLGEYNSFDECLGGLISCGMLKLSFD